MDTKNITIESRTLVFISINLSMILVALALCSFRISHAIDRNTEAMRTRNIVSCTDKYIERDGNFNISTDCPTHTSDNMEWKKVMSPNCIGVVLNGTHKQFPCEESKTATSTPPFSFCDLAKIAHRKAVGNEDIGEHLTLVMNPDSKEFRQELKLDCPSK